MSDAQNPHVHDRSDVRTDGIEELAEIASQPSTTSRRSSTERKRVPPLVERHHQLLLAHRREALAMVRAGAVDP